ncbi:MAG TPA: DUF948 domain-containing protein [Ignavibacteriales bacterium]|nr:DUF948 domain-containing protein [Ignavibacteriales bacterium]HOL82058.1 DUF948 domain-containing protein [Ignavibacteriales bacterium]HOM66123.1 DUF948 domain-containing protein [Ignavibacteriales bacterium]HPD66457.1 DUF948 domain-containing protein [Ignavibacteriales bacterium]HPP34206.1 DUF948 domain-containing protein [Ignavibacteriales bacterium]
MDSLLLFVEILFFFIGSILFIYIIITLKKINSNLDKYDEIILDKVKDIEILHNQINDTLEKVDELALKTNDLLLKLNELSDNLLHDYKFVKSKLKLVPIITSMFSVKNLFAKKNLEISKNNTLIDGTIEAFSKVSKFLKIFFKKTK